MSHGALPHVVSIGICRALGDIAATFDSGQLKVERSRNPAGDDLLQFKTVGKLKLNRSARREIAELVSMSSALACTPIPTLWLLPIRRTPSSHLISLASTGLSL
jgi:hypothetical protein